MLPSTYQSALLLLFLCMICWGSWANTIKLAGPKWRFELFSFDYAIGLLLTAVIAAYTFGSFGNDLGFSNRMLVAGTRMQLYAIIAGVIFNVANMLLIAAISIAGMAVAFPIGIGLALIIGVTLNYFVQPVGNPILLFGGIALVTLAILFDSRAYSLKDKEARAVARAKAAKASEEAAAKVAAATPGAAPSAAKKVSASQTRSKKNATARKGAARGIIISLVSGLLMGCFYPVLRAGMIGNAGDSDIALGAYGAALLFAVGVFGSTLVFNIFFLNIPLVGERIPITNYLQGTVKQHLLGIIGGIIWAVGAIANFAAATAPASINVGPAISLAIGQCATLISVLWGLFVWKEFAGTSSKAWTMISIMLALFVVGLTALCLAPIIKF
jgi:glucose uptake protein